MGAQNRVDVVSQYLVLLGRSQRGSDCHSSYTGHSEMNPPGFAS